MLLTELHINIFLDAGRKESKFSFKKPKSRQIAWFWTFKWTLSVSETRVSLLNTIFIITIFIFQKSIHRLFNTIYESIASDLQWNGSWKREDVDRSLKSKSTSETVPTCLNFTIHRWIVRLAEKVWWLNQTLGIV